MSETRYVHVFRFNIDLNMKMNNTNKSKSSNIELYPGAGLVPEAPVASSLAGMGVDMLLLLDWPCSK